MELSDNTPDLIGRVLNAVYVDTNIINTNKVSSILDVSITTYATNREIANDLCEVFGIEKRGNRSTLETLFNEL